MVKWSIIEDFTAVICVSLISLRAIFRVIFGTLSEALSSVTGNRGRETSQIHSGSSARSLNTKPNQLENESVSGIRRTIELTVTTRNADSPVPPFSPPLSPISPDILPPFLPCPSIEIDGSTGRRTIDGNEEEGKS